jgi:predicted metal-dependent phosphoesterase TrpH
MRKDLNGCVDLHLHSTYSDGTLRPAALVAEAAGLGLRAIALADHDNLDGIAEATEAGTRHHVEVIPGVELSVVWGALRDLHLLGYAFDPDHPGMRAALVEFRSYRANRSQLILGRVNAKLAGEGKPPLDFGTVAARASGTLGRPHIGQALVAAGRVRDMEEAFARYLVPCNVPKRFFPVDEAIRLVHAAGGCAVLAHPLFIEGDEPALAGLIDTLIGLGLDGMEVWCGGAGNDAVDRLLTLARRKRLIATGGSDFHQPGAGPAMGSGLGNLRIPYACVEELKTRAAKYGDQR